MNGVTNGQSVTGLTLIYTHIHTYRQFRISELPKMLHIVVLRLPLIVTLFGGLIIRPISHVF